MCFTALGIGEFVIGVIHDKDIWYYIGEVNSSGKALKPSEKYRPTLAKSKRYDDIDVLRWELEDMPNTLAYKIFESQRCPRCGKEFTNHPVISHSDNEMEICPRCGITEALHNFKNHPKHA